MQLLRMFLQMCTASDDRYMATTRQDQRVRKGVREIDGERGKSSRRIWREYGGRRSSCRFNAKAMNDVVS